MENKIVRYINKKNRRQVLQTIAGGSMLLLAGCSGPPIEFRGPVRVRLFNKTGKGHEAKLEITSENEILLKFQGFLPAGGDTIIYERMPGRKIIGRRSYTVTFSFNDVEPVSSEISYGDGFDDFQIIIEEGGSVTIDTLKAA